MSEKRRTSQIRRFRQASTFVEHLKLALEHHADFALLREYSPLATPYFLNEAAQTADFRSQVSVEVDWGQLLHVALWQTLESLWGGPIPTDQVTMQEAVDEEVQQARGSRYDCLVLELNYFKRIFNLPPKTQADIYHNFLHISRATHNRYLKEAVKRFGEALLKQVHPAVRLEAPRPASVFIGRTAMREQCLAALWNRQSVMITGPGGIGKSALGAAVAERWKEGFVFWFTIRRNFNDRLVSLLFALGHFLHLHGASRLWLQLVASEGKIEDYNLALYLVLADLEAMPAPPLLCFDETDLLRPQNSDYEDIQHVPLVEFINGLRHKVPLLLLGQRAIVESDVTLALDRLSNAEMGEWLRQAQIQHEAEELAQLERYTGGNPRLLTLCIAVHQLRSSFTSSHLRETFEHLPQTPALTPIWERLRSHLPSLQLAMLRALSVFRESAPRDIHIHNGVSREEHLDALEQLIHAHLVQVDGAGSVSLVPALSTVIYSNIAVEMREQLHVDAARIRTVCGEFTLAAYQYARAGRPEVAIDIWFPHRRTEIGRGFGGMALAIFREISAHRLPHPQQHKLSLLRSELYQLHGEVEKTIETLSQTEWPQAQQESIDAMLLWGEALRTQGDIDGARQKYTEGIKITEHLLNKQAQLHFQRGTMYAQQRQMQEAWREASRARYYAENLQGIVQHKLGNITAARTHFRMALALAEEMADDTAVARSLYYLANSARQHEDSETVRSYFQRSIQLYSRVGDQIRGAHAKSNLAGFLLLEKEYSAAVDLAKEALSFFEQVRDPTWIALNACYLAEAYFELGRLSEAERYAHLAIQQEEIDKHPYALYTLGSVRRAENQSTEAKVLYEQALNVATKNEDPFLSAYTQRELGELHYEAGERIRAEKMLLTALNLFQQLDIDEEIQKTETLLGKLNVTP